MSVIRLARTLASRLATSRSFQWTTMQNCRSSRCAMATDAPWTDTRTTADQQVWLVVEEPIDTDDGDHMAWGEGLVHLGATDHGSPEGLHFIDVSPVGTLLTPGRVWAMLEGTGDVRVSLVSPCAGEVVEVNKEAVATASTDQWLVAVQSDGVDEGMLEQDST